MEQSLKSIPANFEDILSLQNKRFQVEDFIRTFEKTTKNTHKKIGKWRCESMGVEVYMVSAFVFHEAMEAPFKGFTVLK